MAQNRSLELGLWLGTLVSFSLAGVTLRTSTTPAEAAPAEQNVAAVAGEIAGKVTFEGAPPKATPIVMAKDPVCSASHDEPVYAEDGAVNSNGTLPNVFIYVKE